jgi:succinyl-diaminopimelate desuccinylase
LSETRSPSAKDNESQGAASVDPLALAQALIRCPSVTPEDAGALQVLEDALQPLGFVCERMPFSEPGTASVDNLYARLGDAGPNLCFAGHTDVVPIGDPAHWTHDPFAADVVDGTLYGRGTADMKGAIASFVAATAALVAERGAGFGGAISLLITGDEEGPAVNGTRKMLAALAARGERLDHCVVGEPTNPDALGEMVKIGRRGSLNGRLTVHGIQGHTAYPQRADNPVHRLVRMLHAVLSEPLDNGTEHFQPSNLQVSTVDVGNPAGNVIPATATAAFNIRFNDRHDAAGLERWLRERFAAAAGDGARYELAVRSSGEAFLTPPGAFSALLGRASAEALGRTPELSTTGGTSDARFIKDYCPVAEFGMVGRTAHQVDEHIAVDDLYRLRDVYLALLRGYFDAPPDR